MYRLWSEEPRARHGLPTVEESDRAVINEAEFLAYVDEFPILVETFGLLGARAMFHRCGSDEMLTLLYTRACLCAFCCSLSFSRWRAWRAPSLLLSL